MPETKKKSVSITRFLGALYEMQLREKALTRIALIGGPSRIINLRYDGKGESAYIRVEGKKKDRLRIVIGGKHIKNIANLPDYITSREMIKLVKDDVFKTFHGTVNHELGHALYTDMGNEEISKYKEPKYIGFMHNVFNILEDPVIEFFMTLYYKKHLPYDVNPKVYFDFIVERAFEAKADEYKDDGTQNGFLNYMLFFVRIGEAKIKNKCAVFEKYKTDLIPLMKNVLQEPDGAKRIHNTVLLCEWIIENIKEFNWEMPMPPEIHIGEDFGKVPGPLKGPGRGPGLKSGEGGEGHDEEGAEGEEPEESEDEKESEDETDEETEDEKESEDETEDESESPMVEEEVDEDVISTIFNDDYRDGSDHVWSIAKEDFEVKDSSLLEDVDRVIDESNSIIRSVSDFLMLFKGRIKPMRTEGMTSGRLAVRRAIKDEIAGGCSTRLFQKKMARGRDADLVVSLLCDNSGSMSGSKSEICAKACIILAQACEWSGIPYEINAFVKTYDSSDGISYTIKEKSFDDSLNEAKPYLGINSSTMLRKLERVNKDVPTFRGNSEEVNIFYIWQQFKKVKHRTKLMFVLCDGMTTGSKNDLHSVVTRMEQEDNIIVIGIGILCKDVVDTYNHAKVFKSIEDLNEGLAPYLIDTLSAYAK